MSGCCHGFIVILKMTLSGGQRHCLLLCGMFHVLLQCFAAGAGPCGQHLGQMHAEHGIPSCCNVNVMQLGYHIPFRSMGSMRQCLSMQVPQGDWYCPRCRDGGMGNTALPDNQLSWRTPGAHDYIRLSHMLGTPVQMLCLTFDAVL